MIFSIIFFVITVVLIYSYYQTVKGEKSIQKLNNSRPILSRFEYIEILTKKGFSKKNIEVVYDEIYTFIAIDNFSMYPEDSIHEVYGIDDLDDVELIDNICKKLNIKEPAQKDFDYLGQEHSKMTAESILALMDNLKNSPDKI